jgi:hypothetical protein
MRPAWSIFAVLGAGGLAAVGFLVARRSERPQPQGAWRVVHASQRMIGSIVNATGTIRLRVGSEVRVGSQLSGIVKKLNAEFAKVVATDEIKGVFQQLGADAISTTPEAFHAMIESEIAKLAPVVKASGAKAD